MIYEAKEFIVKDNLKVVVKTPEIEDAARVLEFIRKAAGQTNFLLSSPDDYKFDVEKEEKFIEDNRKSNNYFLVVEVDGEIVGDFGLNLNRHEKDKHRASIGIAIDEKYWDKGIGSLLFDEAERIAREMGTIEQLELGVNSDNSRAKHLYEKKGFEYTGRIPRAMKFEDGSYHDEEFMVKYLDK